MDKPEVAQTGPYGVDVEAGKRYFWCACGRSKKQPFCDGSHATTAFRPVAYTAETSRQIWFCGCKATGRQPVCDGTHNRL